MGILLLFDIEKLSITLKIMGEIVEYLVSKGANIEAKDDYNYTPLHLASYFGKPDIVKYLVSKGANKNAKDKDGKTPYDLAANNEIRNILKWKYKQNKTK